MAVKTITIDMEAYKRLKDVKQANESFSQTIKRVIKPRFDVDAWLRRIEANPMSPEALKAVEQQVAGRRRRSRRRS
jgi:predicted CopG family antitoxin